MQNSCFERRVVRSRNRDRSFNPCQDGEPVHALPKAYVDIDGFATCADSPIGRGDLAEAMLAEIARWLTCSSKLKISAGSGPSWG